jgi:alpha-galactosidase
LLTVATLAAVKFAVVMPVSLLSAAPEQTADFGSCHASWDGSRLRIGNLYIQREWQWTAGGPRATSFRDLKSGTEWLAEAPGAATAGPAPAFHARSGAMTPVEAPSLVVELSSASGSTYRFRIFPEARGILMQRIEAGKPKSEDMEDLTLAVEHVRLTEVSLMDQTDAHNQLVFEREWLPQRNENPLQLTGNLFAAENTLTHAGLLFLKLAPLPHSRPVPNAWDLEAAVRGRTLQCRFAGTGIDASGGEGYPHVVLAYSGGATGRTEALQSFQRSLRPYTPGRDGMFLSNTWGDRSRDSRISADFMRHEIEAGSLLGVDVIQIDDGWQTGRTANSARSTGVWNGFWSDNRHFWEPDAVRFPEGVSPLVREAAKKGMKFGLWYAPDSSGDFANWQRDAKRLLELHREDGIDYFKIDGVKATTKAGERNLRRMFNLVQQESAGKVVFDLDVTAETRPGYFGVPDAGPIFVENRYTDSHGYWPHQTLRNLWQLASWVDPLRLRMEVLNNQRNAEKYAGDPLAPSVYPPDYLFATVMFSNPLGWFEASNLPPAYRERMAPLVTTWKAHRDRLFSETILPVGDVPDGTNWTGFAAFDKGRNSGYLLLFRGVGASPDWASPLDAFGKGPHTVQLLGGAGEATVDRGEIRARIPASPGFLWVAIQ